MASARPMPLSGTSRRRTASSDGDDATAAPEGRPSSSCPAEPLRPLVRRAATTGDAAAD